MLYLAGDSFACRDCCGLAYVGICLCLIELRYLSGRNGVRSILRVGFVSRSPRLELRRLFGPFVSGLKIPFPGNGDLGSKSWKGLHRSRERNQSQYC